ncbi:MAG: cupin domain-containing protein [Azospirillaceae bacterium]
MTADPNGAPADSPNAAPNAAPIDGGLEHARERGLPVGEIADRVTRESDTCRVWSLTLRPGQATAYHLHRHPHAMVAVTGGDIAIETVDGDTTALVLDAGETRLVEDRGRAERIVNRSRHEQVFSLIEFKAVRWVFAGDLPPPDAALAEADEARAAAFREVLISTSDEAWQPKSLPGLAQKMLWRDEETGASIALIRFEKGAGIPNAHQHASNQFMFCLSGQYRYIPTGTTLVPGTFYWNPEGSVHGPTVADETSVFLEIYDGPHYPVKPSWYSDPEDAR